MTKGGFENFLRVRCARLRSRNTTTGGKAHAEKPQPPFRHFLTVPQCHRGIRKGGSYQITTSKVTFKTLKSDIFSRSRFSDPPLGDGGKGEKHTPRNLNPPFVTLINPPLFVRCPEARGPGIRSAFVSSRQAPRLRTDPGAPGAVPRLLFSPQAKHPQARNRWL